MVYISCQHSHDDIIKWKHFLRYWPFVRGIHRSPVNSLHKGQRRGALTFSLICVWINGWENNREAGDLRRHRAHYDVIVMIGSLDWPTTIHVLHKAPHRCHMTVISSHWQLNCLLTKLFMIEATKTPPKLHDTGIVRGIHWSQRASNSKKN